MKNNLSSKEVSKNSPLYQKTSLILFGLFLTIVILEITLRIGSFTILSLQEHRNLLSIKQKGSFRIMCLGESTTQNQYPPYLEKILNQHKIGIKFSVIDKGIAGINTIAILSQLEANLDKYQPDMIVTMMGVNDYSTHMYYEASYDSKTILILRSLKVYKLTRLLWLHMATRLKEKGLYLQDINKQKDSSKEAYEKLQQERLFKKAIELNPNNDFAYLGLGQLYRNQGKIAEAEQLFKKAIELNPNNEDAYNGLGRFYAHQKKFIEAAQLLKKAIELNPNNDLAYLDLGQLYRDHGQVCRDPGKFTEAEQLFKKAIELNPYNQAAYIGLGQFYRDLGKFTEAEQLFKKTMELNPNNDFAYLDLGLLYRNQSKFIEAEQSFKKAIELNPNNASLYGGLATIYCEMGNNRLFKVYAEKANNLRNEYYNPKTVNNHQVLKQILDKRNIKLVSVQYPMRNIESLKRILGEETDGIIFVDNEKIFKDAVTKTSYKEYFKDMFGGDFGHCTDKGNSLLARNIADAILKEVFGINFELIITQFP